MTRKIEVDAGAVLLLPASSSRMVDIKRGAIVIFYDPDWTAAEVADLATKMKEVQDVASV